MRTDETCPMTSTLPCAGCRRSALACVLFGDWPTHRFRTMFSTVGRVDWRGGLGATERSGVPELRGSIRRLRLDGARGPGQSRLALEQWSDGGSKQSAQDARLPMFSRASADCWYGLLLARDLHVTRARRSSRAINSALRGDRVVDSAA